MNPEHFARGDPCARCGLPATRHRLRAESRREYQRAYGQRRRRERSTDLRDYRMAHPRGAIRRCIGIDGEGWTDKETGQHHYAYLAACDARGLISDVVGQGGYGLRSAEVLNFLLSLPSDPGIVLVGFSLGYDITKWLEDLPNSTLYALNHPELRKGKHGASPVRWGEFLINRMATRFSVKRGGDRCTAWDLFRFFGKAFVPSLQDWRVGDSEVWDRIQEMKEKRGNFDRIREDERRYCQDECVQLAVMADRLIGAHVEAGLPLAQYYGPGSTASVMLKSMGAKAETAVIPDAMREVVDCAFFGGRFEHSAVGPIAECHGYDIASAYPLAMWELPCLKHGHWELVKRPSLQRIERAVAACVRWRAHLPNGAKRVSDGLDRSTRRVAVSRYVEADGWATDAPWGPYPHRLADGNILFPVASPGGWVWKEEFLAGLLIHPNVEAREAWILEQDCDCGHPFEEGVAKFYCLRLEWGKDGKGIVVKLGLNSGYGKRAQRVGDAPFRCATSAGIITSNTRARLLRASATTGDLWNILGFATDGILSRVPLTLEFPPVTQTEELANSKGKTPLGAWEYKGESRQHLIRPGMRFVPDAPDKRIDTTAARGLGVKVLHKNRAQVLESWALAPMKDVYLQQPALFMGCKSSIRATPEARMKLTKVLRGERSLGEMALELRGEFTRGEDYGRWVVPEPRVVSYNPLPKRPGYEPDTHRLLTWALSPACGESVGYGRAPKSKLAQELAELALLEEEQADQEGFRTYAGPEDA